MSVPSLAAGLETGNLSEFTGSSTGGTGAVVAASTDRAYQGSWALKAFVTNDGYARGQWNIACVQLDEIWYGCAVYLPPGFYAAQQSQIDLIRWDNFDGVSPYVQGGLVIFKGDSRLRLMLFTQTPSASSELVDTGTIIPEGRWVFIEARQKLSATPGVAVNEVWIDGRRIGESTLANLQAAGDQVTRMRVGIVSTGTQSNDLTVYADAIYIDAVRRGPGAQAVSVVSERPPLDLNVSVMTPDGVTRPWADAGPADSRPQNLAFSTRRGDGFAEGGLTLARRGDRDYPDINLLDGVTVHGAGGQVAYEGRIMSASRSFTPDGPSIDVALAGWMSVTRQRKIREIIVDRDLSHWTGPSVQRRVDLATGGFQPLDPQTGADPTTGNPALEQTFTGAWAATGKPNNEALYDARGIPLDSLYFAWKKNTNVNAGDTNWGWFVLLSKDDVLSSNDGGANLRATGPGTGTLTATTTNRTFAAVTHRYSAAGGSGGVPYSLFWTCLAVYGRHGLTKQGVASATSAQGFTASDIIRYLFAAYAPSLNTAGITATTYPIQQAVWLDPIDLYDAVAEINRFHRYELGCWQDRTVTWAPVDLTDYDWEIRLGDPGTTTTLQGDTVDQLANGITVSYQDLQTGTARWVTPVDEPLLADSTATNPANRWGEQIWTNLDLSAPCTRDDAIQIGRAALTEFNQPRSPGTITVTGHVRDRAGAWQPCWKVRAGDRVVISDSLSLSDRPRLIGETSYQHPGRLTLSTETTLPRVDAYLDRLSASLSAAGLT